MKFNINNYSKDFNRFVPGYGGLGKFIILDQYVGFPEEVYNFSCTDVDFLTDPSTPNLKAVKVRLC
jgi:hypothetical protein